MANIKLSPNQYLGSQELNKFKEFLSVLGYKKLFKLFVKHYGIAFPDTDNLKVIQGSTNNKITISKGFALDTDLNVISIDEQIIDYWEIPVDDVWYYVKIKYKIKNTEKGTVSVNTDGLVSGVGTEFTKLFRGNPTNPIKVRLLNSLNNLADYEVIEVIDDTTMYLGTPNLVVENQLTYAVVGSFAPSVLIKEENKLIYEYDDFEIFIENNIIISKNEYLLSQIRNQSGVVTILDVRYSNVLTLI